MAKSESSQVTMNNVHPPDLPELLRPDLQVVERSSHSHHHLAAVTGGHADVLAIGLFPLTHQGFGFLANESDRGRGDLGREKTPLFSARMPHHS